MNNTGDIITRLAGLADIQKEAKQLLSKYPYLKGTDPITKETYPVYRILLARLDTYYGFSYLGLDINFLAESLDYAKLNAYVLKLAEGK